MEKKNDPIEMPCTLALNEAAWDGEAGAVCKYWCELKRDHAGVPPRESFDPGKISDFLPKVILLDVLNDGDFSYRLIGTQVDVLFGGYFTGRRVSTVPGHGPGGRIHRLYAQAAETDVPVQVRLRYVGPSALCEAVTMAAMPLSLPDGRLQLLGAISFHLAEQALVEGFLADHARRA